MSKSRTLSGLVSDGGALADGIITATDIGALSLSGGTLTGDLVVNTKITAPVFTGVTNAAGVAGPVTLQAGTGTGLAGTSGGNGYVYIAGGGATSSWTSFAGGNFPRRRGGVLLQAGISAIDAGATYASGSTIQLQGAAGTTNGTSYGVGSLVVVAAGDAVNASAGTNTGAVLTLTGASSNSGGPASLIAGSGTATNNNGGAIDITAGNAFLGFGTGGNLTLRAGSSTTSNAGNITISGGSTTTGLAGYVRINTAGTERVNISAAGITTVYNTSAAAIVTQLLLSNLSSSDGTGARLAFSALDDGSTITGSITNVRDGSGTYSLRFSTYGGSGSTEYLRISSGGILGLSVVPQSTWGTTSRAIQIGLAASISSSTSGSAVNTSVNAFDSQTGWKYINTAVASNYYQELGAHVWRTAASGTAGAAISWSEVVRIDSSGNVGIGTSTPGALLQLNKASGAADLRLSVGGTLYANIYASSSDTNIFSVAATPLIFGTSNTERARIDSSGKVLIGFTASKAISSGQLQVKNIIDAIGNDATTPTAVVAYDHNALDASPTYSSAILRKFGPSATGNLYFASSITAAGWAEIGGINVQSGVAFGTNSNVPIVFGSAGTERMRIDTGGHLLPGATNTSDLGSTTKRWRNIYTQDLHLSNGVGDYTVVEGETELYLVNNKTGKHFKFALIPVDPSEVPAKSEVA